MNRLILNESFKWAKKNRKIRKDRMAEIVRQGNPILLFTVSRGSPNKKGVVKVKNSHGTA